MADYPFPDHWWACALNVPSILRERMGWADACDCDLALAGLASPEPGDSRD